MNSNEYADFLLRNIKPFAKLAGGRKEVNCRCFYCADSDDIRHGHFYIKVNLDGKEPSYFYCQKCGARGTVTSQKLLEWGIYDANLGMDITKYNKDVMNLPQNMKFRDKIVYNINNYIITESELSYYKLAYINERLGTNLTLKDCLEKKIIINLKDLLRNNYLEYTRHPNIIDQLDYSFIGFLSYDNAFINMRNLNLTNLIPSIDKRYVNYNVFNKYDNTTKFYIIPNNIDILKPVRIHIAEGPFDILSILYNLNGGNIGNDIYAAATGSGYIGLLKFIILNLKMINIEVHIYPDNDVSDQKINRVKERLFLFNTDFYIHRNNSPGEKDFGVPPERIKEIINRI